MKFNWKQFVVHSIAAYSLMLAFRTLACFSDINLLEKIIRLKSDPMTDQGQELSKVLSFLIKISLIGSLGLFIAFIVSLLISLKNKWGWFNSVAMFSGIYLLGWIGFRGESVTSFLFSSLDNLIHDIKLEVFAVGVLLLLSSMLFFFSRTTNRFISKVTQTPEVFNMIY